MTCFVNLVLILIKYSNIISILIDRIKTEKQQLLFSFEKLKNEINMNGGNLLQTKNKEYFFPFDTIEDELSKQICFLPFSLVQALAELRTIVPYNNKSMAISIEPNFKYISKRSFITNLNWSAQRQITSQEIFKDKETKQIVEKLLNIGQNFLNDEPFRLDK